MWYRWLVFRNVCVRMLMMSFVSSVWALRSALQDKLQPTISPLAHMPSSRSVTHTHIQAHIHAYTVWFWFTYTVSYVRMYVCIYVYVVMFVCLFGGREREIKK